MQKPSKKRTWPRKHKGGIYHNLGVSLLLQQAPEKSKSYFLLAIIEDILNQNSVVGEEFKNAPAYQTALSLNIFTGVRVEKQIAYLKKIAGKHDGKDLYRANPELLLIEIFTNAKGIIPAQQLLLPDQSLLKMLIKEARNTPGKTVRHEQGKFFELLAAYLFIASGKDFEIGRRVKTRHAEHDLLIRNLNEQDTTFIPGRYLLVESKNTKNPATTTMIKKFIFNLHFARCNTGVLFARNNVTGIANRQAAWHTIRITYHRDNIIVIVLTLNDLSEMVESKASLFDVLKTKYEDIRFDIK